MSQPLIEPAFLVLTRRLRLIGAEHVFAEDDGVGVFVSQDGAQGWARLEIRVQIHHVAAIAEGRRQIAKEIAAAHETPQGNLAVGQLPQPGSQKDGKSAVAIYIGSSA